MSDQGETTAGAAERMKISLDALEEILRDEFTKVLGRDASALLRRIRFRGCDGRPNWEANLGIAAPATLAAFLDALSRVQATYDLDETSHRQLPHLS